MERAFGGDDPVALGPAVHEVIAARHFQRRLDRFRARVAEKDAVGKRRRHQPLGVALLLRDPEQVGDVPQPARLPGQGLDQVGMGVTQGVDGDTGGEIQITPPVSRCEIGTFAALEGDVHSRIVGQQGWYQKPAPVGLPRRPARITLGAPRQRAETIEKPPCGVNAALEHIRVDENRLGRFIDPVNLL